MRAPTEAEVITCSPDIYPSRYSIPSTVYAPEVADTRANRCTCYSGKDSILLKTFAAPTPQNYCPVQYSTMHTFRIHDVLACFYSMTTIVYLYQPDIRKSCYDWLNFQSGLRRIILSLSKII